MATRTRKVSRTTAGKQPKSSVLTRAVTMLTLLPLKPPGQTAQQVRDALAERGFHVDKRTVERDLADLALQFPIVCAEEHQPFRWYWMPGANPYLPQLMHRLASVGRSTIQQGAMARKEIPLRCTPLEDFAQCMGVAEAEVLEDFHSGSLNGAQIGGRWYVLELARILVPDRARQNRALLQIAATLDKGRLTAGGRVVELALNYDETQIDEAVEKLFRAIDRKKARFVQVTLGRRSYEVHESLWQAIGNALVSWQLDMDLVKALTAQGARRI
jgi:hypothetical protein